MKIVLWLCLRWLQWLWPRPCLWLRMWPRLCLLLLLWLLWLLLLLPLLLLL